MEKKISEKKRFSIIARVKSTNNAWRGFIVFLKTTHNLWVQIFFAFLAVYLGFILKISIIEWSMIIFATGLVFVTEALNTAFEIDIDLTSPKYHPYAKDTKDVAAGAVLISTFISSLIGLLIFLPKIFELFN
jgi:diacylglycerol kinase